MASGLPKVLNSINLIHGTNYVKFNESHSLTLFGLRKGNQNTIFALKRLLRKTKLTLNWSIM